MNYKNNYWINFLEDPNNTVYLAITKSNVIGAIRITLNDPDEKSETAILGGFYVNENYRRIGVGKSLLKTAINFIKKNSKSTFIRLYVKPSQIAAIKLYKKLGFKECGKNFDELIMEKRIVIVFRLVKIIVQRKF